MSENPNELADRIAKLPEWARRYIQKLEADNKYLLQERHEVGTGESLIWFSLDYQARIYIPSRAIITFSLPTGEIEFRLRNGVVLVEGDYPYVMPDASNCMTIGLIKR